MKPWVWLTISFFGVSGKFSKARGTWGTLAAMPFAWLIQISLGNIALAIAALLVFILGTIASEKYVQATAKQDPGEIVIDEVAAIFLLLAFMQPNWQCYLLAFFVFRIFDVLKPFPVSLADKHIKGGFGVMFDDILAALYPVALFLIAEAFFPQYTIWMRSWLMI